MSSRSRVRTRATPSGEAIDLIRAYVRTATLRPVVRLRTIRRTTQLLDFDDRGLGEVVDDEVSVLAGRRIAARFRELEVEITDDTPDGLLDEVLRRLREAGAGAADPTAKYVRAVGPLALEPPEVRVLDLPRDATVGAVLGRALSRSAIHLIRNDAVMRLDVDPEGVHQARVASRRLRSDLRTFRTALDPAWAEPLREELRWLGSVLGEARDADVLFDRVRGRAGTIPPPEAPGAATVIEGLEHRRKEAHIALIEALRGDRYITLLDRIVEAAGAPAVLPDADVPVRDIAIDLLRGPWTTPAPSGAVGGQATERRGAAHHPDPREESALRGRHSGAAHGQVGAILRGGRGRIAGRARRAQRRGGRRGMAADLGRRPSVRRCGLRGRHARGDRACRRRSCTGAMAEGLEGPGVGMGEAVTAERSKSARRVRAGGGIVWRQGPERDRGRAGSPARVRRLVVPQGQAPRWGIRARRRAPRGRGGDRSAVPCRERSGVPVVCRRPEAPEDGPLLGDDPRRRRRDRRRQRDRRGPVGGRVRRGLAPHVPARPGVLRAGARDLVDVIPVFLVRHAFAGDRAHWSGPDDRRPLTEEGQLQADALAETLADQPFAHLLSSPSPRCIQTFVPLARPRGLQIEERDELAEGRPLAYIEKLVLEAATAGPAALCVHGDGMQHLVAELFDRGAVMTGDRDDHDKGGVWVLEVRDGAIATGRYVPPPLV